MRDTVNQPLQQVSDLRHRVRRLHWFCESFKRETQSLGQRHGIAFSVNDRALVEAFFNWAARFEQERAASTRNRRDFAIFAGGLMLGELLLTGAVKGGNGAPIAPMIPPDPSAPIVAFWPEGFLCTHYCLTLVRAILEQDFDVRPAPNPQLEDLRTWQSFRENFRSDPTLAVAFFDVFMGVEPNWVFPQSFLSRPSVQQHPELGNAKAEAQASLAIGPGKPN